MAKKALCLSGGATRGSFQMGAIKCLYEQYGFRPDIITATSVGAINGIKLACAPPPAVNDSRAILTAVSAGQVDAQLRHMRELEQFWLAADGRDDFFLVREPFKGTMVESALAENAPPGMPIGTQIDLLGIGLNLPIVHIFAAILAADELRKIKSLITTVTVENGIAEMSPVDKKLREPANIMRGMAEDAPPYDNNLYHGTPLYMATVSLETGKLRYITNRAEFYERDGVAPVATALLDADVDAALDENLQPLSAARRANIKFAVSKYQAAVNQIAAYHPELVEPSTPRARAAFLAAETERERQRGIYWAKAARRQIEGVRIKTVVRDGNGAADPVTGAIASASLPVLTEPPAIGVERYIDAGLREIIPLEISLREQVTQIVGVLCSTLELPEADSMKSVGLIDVGLRATTSIAINEITAGDLAEPIPSNVDLRIIAPLVDVHGGMDLDPSLVEIGMQYGWMRAVDEMHPDAAPEERDVFRQTSELITRLRVQCLEIERRVATRAASIASTQRWDYFELRVRRWAIFHLVTRRTALGLPSHPSQAMWATDWEREFRGSPPYDEFASVWSDLLVRWTTVPEELWPASSPSAFSPDVGSIEDAGSDRIYWLVRGAVFEDHSGAAPPAPLADVVVPNGLHQFLPRIPTGAHLMAETQAPSTLHLVIGGKRYSAPTPEWIAAAGLSGATVALVPQGGMQQIPDGGVPSFLGNLAIVDATLQAVAQVRIERLQQSDTTHDLSIRNRSAAALTGIAVAPVGFGPEQGISVEDAPAAVAANTVDFLTLRLRPTVAGVFDGALRIDSSDTLFPQLTVPLRLVVLPLGELADLQIAPAQLTIDAPVNATTSYSTVTVTNAGGVAPDRISAWIEPPAATSLFLVGLVPQPAAFAPGSPVGLAVFFYPTAAGTFTGELALSASGTTSLGHPYERTVRIPLVGNAGASTIRLLARKPRADDFPPGPRRPSRDMPRTSLTIHLGAVQPPVNDAATVFILNHGTLPLEIPAMLGYYANPVAGQAFPITVAPGKWAQVHLDFGTFRAPPIGAFSETLRILSNDPITPEAQVVLDGAVVGAKGAIRPEYIDFGVVAVNSPVQRTTAFENQGTVELHVDAIKWRNGADFRLAQPPALPVAVPAGGTLGLTVEFGPVAAPGVFGDYCVLGTTEGVQATLAVQARTS